MGSLDKGRLLAAYPPEPGLRIATWAKRTSYFASQWTVCRAADNPVVRRMAWAFAIALAVAGCQAAALLSPEGSLRTYERTAAQDSLGIKLVSAAGQGWLGGWGCSAVSVPWTVSIGAAGRNGAVGEYIQLVSSADVTNPADAEIWIDWQRTALR